MKKLTVTLNITDSYLDSEIGAKIDWEILFIGNKPTKKELNKIHSMIIDDSHPCTQHSIKDEDYFHFDMSDMLSYYFSEKISTVDEKIFSKKNVYFLDRNYSDNNIMLLPSSYYSNQDISLEKCIKIFNFISEYKEDLEYEGYTDKKIDENEILLNEARYLYNQYIFYNNDTINELYI